MPLLRRPEVSFSHIGQGRGRQRKGRIPSKDSSTQNQSDQRNIEGEGMLTVDISRWLVNRMMFTISPADARHRPRLCSMMDRGRLFFCDLNMAAW